MKKRRALVLGWLAVIMAVGGMLALYATVGFYYRGSFFPGTYINSVYCTGKSVEEVNEELKSLFSEESFSMRDTFGHQYEILLSDIQFEIDYSSQLHDLQNPKHPLLWAFYLKQAAHNTLVPHISFDEELLREALLKCGMEEIPSTESDSDIVTVEIRFDTCYELFDGRKHLLDREMVYETVKEALLQESFSVDFTDCYVDLPYTEKMQETLTLWEKIEDFQTCGIVYDMGDEQIALTPQIVCKWITLEDERNLTFALDDDGNLILNEQALEAFIDELCAAYNTYGSTRTFQSTRGDNITIEGGTYGNKIDREAEIAYLKEALLTDVNEVHVPAYEREAYVRGKDDIGDTYVEVDMTEQKLYFYEEGELKFETDIVTGNTGRRMGTPTGVNYIYNMQQNRTLRGPGYAAPVKYWVPVKGNIGIHDASWRKNFGGEIYKTNGSHGCINVPSDKMAELYDMLEIGIPVVMFY
ncbi:MAG: L,D-transpeptidase family protein [Lachnospiraceae bacterium]